MLGLILAAQIIGASCSDGLATWPIGPDGRCHSVDRDRATSYGLSGSPYITNLNPRCERGILVMTVRGAPMCAIGLITPILNPK